MCTCLLNMYTSCTHHIHKEHDDPCTCCVCVVYVLDKHVHAFNFLNFSIVRAYIPGCVCVWRLILKKIPCEIKYFFSNFLSHRHKVWVSINYAWQKHVFPVTFLSHKHSLVTAMWQEINLPVTHNLLIHNKYDGVTGKMRKNFFCKVMMKKCIAKQSLFLVSFSM